MKNWLIFSMKFYFWLQSYNNKLSFIFPWHTSLNQVINNCCITLQDIWLLSTWTFSWPIWGSFASKNTVSIHKICACLQFLCITSDFHLVKPLERQHELLFNDLLIFLNFYAFQVNNEIVSLELKLISWIFLNWQYSTFL